jgi:hypothetical protein
MEKVLIRTSLADWAAYDSHAEAFNQLSLRARLLEYPGLGRWT